MKSEISDVLKSNTIPGVVGGRDVLIIGGSKQINALVADLENLFKRISDENNAEDSENDVVDEIIDHMNQCWKTAFRKKTHMNRQFISGRLRDGHSPEDLKLVINHMKGRWSNDPKMSQYLRPKTVFAPSNFEGYLESARRVGGYVDVIDAYGNSRTITTGQFNSAEPGFFKLVKT